MSFSFGFYNALNHDRLYDAVQVSEIFDGIIQDGVYSTIGDHFVVRPANSDNMVIVGSGRAWFDHTWNKNDADLPVPAPQPDLLMYRYDALVIDINSNVAYRENTITWVEGVASLNNPVKPTLIHTTDHNQYPLCYVRRRPNVNRIETADIENAVGTDACPFVTGLLQQISITDLLTQWGTEWDAFLQSYEDQADTWMTDWERDMTTWTTTQQADFTSWMTTEKAEFLDWFNNLQIIIDENVVARLTAQIMELQGRWHRLIRTYDVLDGIEDNNADPIVDNNGISFTGHVTYMLAADRYK